METNSAKIPSVLVFFVFPVGFQNVAVFSRSGFQATELIESRLD